jgi:hypothetical protein
MNKLAVAAITLIPSIAWGNAAEPTSYTLKPEGEGVLVCPRNFRSRGCPDPGGMLRQNVKTGEVVKLNDACKGDERESDPGCYLDACVPAGTYRYGFAKPYACQSSSASTDYWEDITVADGCKGEATKHAAFEGKVPWEGKEQAICHYQGGGSNGDNGCAHCTVGAVGSRLAPALFALGLGLMLLRRRET